ncbi:MAG: hypothetical protein JWM80_549 [Cyanobacteria bacterium RYN_339]|nr:hypothetical protein [Cyanobacteria bacterium RYN_339]
MIDGLTSSRLFQYMRQANPQPAAVAPAYVADRWVPSNQPAQPFAVQLPNVDLQGLWDQLMSRYRDFMKGDDTAYVTELYKTVLGREPDAAGLASHTDALRHGVTRDELRQLFQDSPEAKQRGARPAPAPAPAQAAPPPISIDIVKGLATAYVAQHPEIAEAESYVDTAKVAQLREGVIAMLIAKGCRAGRILGPDGKPYDQMIAFGNANDPMAQAYRVTAGGGPIRRAITVGYTNDPAPWSDVH